MKTAIPPQYNDGSNLSRELGAFHNLIDAIIEFKETTVKPPEYFPACLQKALDYCNGQTHAIMARMDDIDYPASKLPSAVPSGFVSDKTWSE